MTPAAERLAEVLQAVTIRAPKVPVIHNVDARAHSEPEAIRTALVHQLHRPVRWVEVIRAMTADGLTLFIEPGPGKVLSGLGKRIERDASFLPVFDPESLAKALQSAMEI
jgi:[acyl-carrier-protein] S-malonyltransferase